MCEINIGTMNMKNPFWFNIIEQWKLTGKGEYGVTFPFLIGAMVFANKKEITNEFVGNIFQEIINNPVADYYCEVRWCGDIDEPVASIKKLEDLHKVSIKSKFFCKNTEIESLAFTTDLMSTFNLECAVNEECTSNEDCLNRLICRTLEESVKGNFSKNDGYFAPFSEDDIKFIELVSSL